MYRTYTAIFVFAAAVVLFNCSESSVVTPQETNPFEGVWKAALEDSWEVYLQLTLDMDDSYSGAFSSYLDGLQYASGATGGITTDDSSIHMLFNPDAGIVFDGSLSSSDREMEGQLQYPDGSRRLITFTRFSGDAPIFVPRSDPTSLYAHTEPVDRGDGISVSSLEESGLSREPADSLMAAIARREAGEIHAVLIAKDGKLVFEEYFYDYDADTPHRLHSCTKSVVSLLAGIADGDGLMPSQTDTLADLFPDKCSSSDGVAAVTWGDVLGMTSGFGNCDAIVDEDGTWLDVLFSSPTAAGAGKSFRYDDNNSHIAGMVIAKETGESLDLYAEKHLFGPLDIEDYSWERHDNGSPTAHTGLALRSRDFLKIGMTVLNGGTWNGNDIVPAEWIERATKPRTHVEGAFSYGLHWWVMAGQAAGLPDDIPVAQGAGGQRLFVIPSLNAVCLVFGGNFDTSPNLKSVEPYLLAILAPGA